MLKIRKFEPSDAAAVSGVVRETMKISNSRDYSEAILKPLIEYFSPEKILQINDERHCFIAESDGRIVGTAALEGAELFTFFVLPDFQKKGIGAELLAKIEEQAAGEKIDKLYVGSSVTGVSFYEKSGYRRTGEERETTAGKQICLEKMLSR